MRYYYRKIYNIYTLLLITNINALNSNIRNYILRKQNNKCGLCYKNFSKLIPHEIHHINHNSSDNNEYNLLALCCNCHTAHHRYNVFVKPILKNNSYNINLVEPYNINY